MKSKTRMAIYELMGILAFFMAIGYLIFDQDTEMAAYSMLVAIYMSIRRLHQ